MLTLEQAIKLCKEIRPGFSLRDTANKEMEKIYLLEMPDDMPTGADIKLTMSPDGRNALQGATRLMTAADPKWSVPEDMNKLLDNTSSTIEKLASSIWQAAGRVQGKPRHYDPVLSGLLYGETTIIPTCTKDLIDSAPVNLKRRYEDVYAQTPLLFDTIQPASAFPVYDGLGLSVFHSFRRMNVRDIVQRWDKAKALLGGDPKLSDPKTVGEYWDYETHYVWIDGVDGALVEAKNEWGFIPVSSGITEGSDLFTGAGQHTRQPFLYTMWKSDLWQRQNLALTVMYSLIFAVGANPMFLFEGEDGPVVDYSNVGGMTKIKPGERYGQLAKSVIDPSLMQGLEIAQQKGIESTIYRQSLGEPLGGNAPFSMVAMLAQAGRLPLVPYQRMISHVIGDAMAKGLRMLKIHEDGFSVREQKNLVEVDGAALPDRIEIECTLNIDMPQDQAANAQIASAVTAGDTPLMSIETAQKKYMGIEQPEEELRLIWNERAATMRFMTYLQQQIQMAQQQQQQPQQGMQQPQGLPPEMMGQVPPEMMGGPMPQEMGEMPNQRSTGAQPGVPGVPLPGPLPAQGEPEVIARRR